MSRYGDANDYDGESFPGEFALQEANFERALRGKRGQKFLADLRAALLALPEPRLVYGALCTVDVERRAGDASEGYADELRERVAEDGEGVCAIGAYLWYQRVAGGADPLEAFAGLPTLLDVSADLHDTADLAVAAGVVSSVAWRVAYRNDETYQDMTPEERHAAFLSWIDEHLAVPA